jgi:Protein of unknown function (DUF1239).
MVVMLLLFFVSCGKEKTEVVEVAFDPETTFTMRTFDALNIVSDSGVIRYRMTSKEGLFFGKAEEPYWKFPQGVYVEKIDSTFRVEASIKADSVLFNTKTELWELIRNVKIENLQGERFETEHLFWDQKAQRIYSDEFIKIERADNIITGIGFESNQDMTRYQVFNSQGVFPVNETPKADSVVVRTPSD